jgi:1,4-dihydroxy-2-naphthoate octaprenyltransferase
MGQKIKFHPGPMRGPFLILTPACVLLGLGTALWELGDVNYFDFALVLVGALAAHISVNAFNEYFDFKSGLDLKTKRTPFSGGSGTLPANPELARGALATAVVALTIVGAAGVYFLTLRGLGLLPLGVVGMFVVASYTSWITRFHVLCLLAPGLGFGTLMVMGTDYVLTGTYTWAAFVASLLPFFLVNNLLLLNQFPDVEADREAGRRHLPIVIGRRASSVVYGLFLLLAYLSIIVGIVLDLLPPMCLLGLVTLVLAVPAAIGAWRHADNIEKLVPFLVMNVAINILTPVLTAVGLFIG